MFVSSTLPWHALSFNFPPAIRPQLPSSGIPELERQRCCRHQCPQSPNDSSGNSSVAPRERLVVDTASTRWPTTFSRPCHLVHPPWPLTTNLHRASESCCRTPCIPSTSHRPHPDIGGLRNLSKASHPENISNNQNQSFMSAQSRADVFPRLPTRLRDDTR